MPFNHKAHRVALFLPSLRGGGAERVMVNLARGFSDRGFDVDLVLAGAGGRYLAQVPPGVRVVNLHASRVLASLPGLVRYLRRERPRVLFSALDHANVVALWASKLAAVPCRVVVSVHSTISYAARTASTARARLMPYLVRRFYPWADAIIAVSQGVAEDLARITGLPRERIQAIYNPIVAVEIMEKAAEPLEHAWFQPGQAPVILSVGRLVPAKDYPTLIRAFAVVRAQYPVRLMVLGEGDERANLELLVDELGLTDDVSLPGFVDNPYKFMARAAVFVLSSRREGFGNVLAEAMTVGTPVVSTDCPSGPAEILESGKWGRLVRVGDPQMLADALLDALAQRHDPAALRVRALAFRLESVIGKFLEVLDG